MLSSHGGKPLSNNEWLPLNEFSAKHRVSLSTLRRRIRAGDVEYRFEEGKYWLIDKPIAKHLRVSNLHEAPVLNEPTTEEVSAPNSKILQELKSAYVQVLQDKEEQILHLRNEIVDLNTLIKILESENERLSANHRESAPIDSWLEKNFDI
jgi:hypothetical protein